MTRLNISIVVTTFVACFSLSFSLTKIQKNGYVVPDSFHCKSRFTTVKTLIVIPVEINGDSKNFLFDTGADITMVQRDTVKGKTTKINGATNRKMKVGNEIVKSIKIGDVEFIDTYTMNGDFVGLKEQIPNFGGLIGQPIIRKANWLINYPQKTIELSNQNLIDNTFTILKVKTKHGLPYVTLSINGENFTALIDLGSSSALSIPEDSKLAKTILENYVFNDNERDIYTIGGLQKTKEKTGEIATVFLDEFEFKNIPATIRYTSQVRIGNDFFKDYVVYIDNTHTTYFLKKAIE